MVIRFYGEGVAFGNRGIPFGLATTSEWVGLGPMISGILEANFL